MEFGTTLMSCDTFGLFRDQMFRYAYRHIFTSSCIAGNCPNLSPWLDKLKGKSCKFKGRRFQLLDFLQRNKMWKIFFRCDAKNSVIDVIREFKTALFYILTKNIWLFLYYIFFDKKRRMWIIDFGKCDICHIRNPTYFINASKKKKNSDHMICNIFQT